MVTCGSRCSARFARRSTSMTRSTGSIALGRTHRQAVRQPFDVGHHDRDQQELLGREVAVQGAERDVGPLGDLAHLHRVPAALEGQLERSRSSMRSRRSCCDCVSVDVRSLTCSSSLRERPRRSAAPGAYENVFQFEGSRSRGEPGSAPGHRLDASPGEQRPRCVEQAAVSSTATGTSSMRTTGESSSAASSSTCAVERRQRPLGPPELQRDAQSQRLGELEHRRGGVVQAIGATDLVRDRQARASLEPTHERCGSGEARVAGRRHAHAAREGGREGAGDPEPGAARVGHHDRRGRAARPTGAARHAAR